MKIKQVILLLCLCVMLAGCRQEPVETESMQIPTNEAVETTIFAEPAETEPLMAEPDDSDFVAVKDYIPNILVELKYATSDNFLGRAVYGFQDVYLRYGTVKKLMAVQQELEEQGFRLKIWDGFRPLSAQRALWEICPDPNYVSNPDTGRCTHCRGNTVDLTLAAIDGYGLEMPTEFDVFSDLADRDYSDCSETAARNARLLEEVMEKHGFSGYVKEWWHFSDEEDYPIEECFDPGLVSQWYADCNEYISLRTQPDTSAEVITRIPAGDVMTLLGYDNDFSMVSYNGQQGYVLTAYTAPASENGVPFAGENRISLNKPWYYAVCDNFISLRAEADPGAEVITQISAGEEFQLLEWNGDFALVDYKGLRGYVLVRYIQPV